jgi:hypothetical protein
VILLDNRYEFDKEVNDRLGNEQWKWLDQALKRGKNKQNVRLTVIAAGVQILPDRGLLGVAIESFNWENKQKLF